MGKEDKGLNTRLGEKLMTGFDGEKPRLHTTTNNELSF